MIEARGKIAAIDGDYALVSISDTGCGRCHEAGGCGGNNLTQMLCTSPKTYRVLNPRQARVGDSVVVVVAEKSVFRGAVAAYGLPLLALLAGALIGLALAGEAGAIIGAVGGLFFSWCFLRMSGKWRNGDDPDSQPFIK